MLLNSLQMPWGFEMTVKRINRFDQDRGYITKAGIKRIVRGRDVVGLSENHQVAPISKPVRNRDDVADCLLVVVHAKAGEISALDRELLYVACALAESASQAMAVHAVIFGSVSPLPWDEYGVDQVSVFDEMIWEQYVPDAKVAELKKLHAQLNPKHVVFCESEFGDSDVARRFAIATQLHIATHIYELTETHVRRAFGYGRYQAQSVFPPILVLESGTAGDLDLEFVTAPVQQTLVATGKVVTPDLEERMSLPSHEIPLAEAEFIVSAGNGVKNMETFHRFAKVLDATVGGSRVVVDDGKLPRSCQIGATGQLVKASVYLGIGISGAIQHLQGIKDCNYVIAVNVDETCDLVKRADLAVIEDAETWMQSVIDRMEYTE